VAGGDESSKNGAAVAAVRFSSNIKLITEYKIKNSGDVIHCIKRHENGNILFVGATSKVTILFFDGSDFETVAEYPNLPLGSITHLQLLDEELYCVSPNNAAMLKITYTSRSVEPLTKDKPKVEKAIVAQFTVGSKKSVKLPQKATWMKLGPQKKYLLVKSSGRLNILEKKDGKKPFDFSQAMKDTGIFFQDLLMLSDGTYMVTSPQSNHLKMLTSSGEEITEISPKGPQSYHPSVISLVSQKSFDPHIFLWPMGAGFMGIVDLQKMEMDKAPGVGGLGIEDSLSYLALATHNGSKVLTINIKNATNVLYFSFWQKIQASRTVTRSTEYVYPKRRDFLPSERRLRPRDECRLIHFLVHWKDRQALYTRSVFV
jgi:hypothetical protein